MCLVAAYEKAWQCPASSRSYLLLKRCDGARHTLSAQDSTLGIDSEQTDVPQSPERWPRCCSDHLDDEMTQLIPHIARLIDTGRSVNYYDRYVHAANIIEQGESVASRTATSV